VALAMMGCSRARAQATDQACSPGDQITLNLEQH
jgi:hypothetical protein